MKEKSSYVNALCKEMELRKKYLNGERIDSIYFGGGTPSQLEKNDFELLFLSLFENFDVSPAAEITLEANPDDLNGEFVEMLHHLPFNRISIGIQSFDDSELIFLNRRHSAKAARDAVNVCKSVGFENISIDLMYGLPEQKIETWIQNLEEAIDLNIQHISSYHLIYEEGTKLYNFLHQGKVKSVDEELSVEMFSTMIDTLKTANFIHYEISNFAKENFYSKHNSSYWLGTKYLGLGSSAHSFDAQNRAFNPSSITSYIDSMNKGLVCAELEILNTHTRYNEFVLTGMRTIWGVDLLQLEEKFGEKLLNYCLANVDKYLLTGQVLRDNHHLKLGREGVFVSDRIMSDLMWVN